MSERIEVFDVTVIAGFGSQITTQTPLSFPDGIVDQVEIIIPDGCSGLVGVQLAVADQVIIPYDASAFIRGNDEKIAWPLHEFPSTGAWQMVSYNADIYDHTIQVRFLVTELTTAAALAGPVPILNPAAIEAANIVQ